MNHSAHTGPDPELVRRAARLWPHREHEANGALGLFCRVGVHRWRRLDLEALMLGHDFLHCFWCSKVKIDGVVGGDWRKTACPVVSRGTVWTA